MSEEVELNALSIALHESAPNNHNLGEGVLRVICEDPWSHRPRAYVILGILAAQSKCKYCSRTEPHDYKQGKAYVTGAEEQPYPGKAED